MPFNTSLTICVHVGRLGRGPVFVYSPTSVNTSVHTELKTNNHRDQVKTYLQYVCRLGRVDIVLGYYANGQFSPSELAEPMTLDGHATRAAGSIFVIVTASASSNGLKWPFA